MGYHYPQMHFCLEYYQMLHKKSPRLYTTPNYPEFQMAHSHNADYEKATILPITSKKR